MSDRVLNIEDVDRLGQAVISLAKEIWVLRDRQHILEAALEEAGVLPVANINSHEPSDEMKTALRDERNHLINNLLDTLITPPLDTPQR